MRICLILFQSRDVSGFHHLSLFAVLFPDVSIARLSYNVSHRTIGSSMASKMSHREPEKREKERTTEFAAKDVDSSPYIPDLMSNRVFQTALSSLLVGNATEREHRGVMREHGPFEKPEGD